ERILRRQRDPQRLGRLVAIGLEARNLRVEARVVLGQFARRGEVVLRLLPAPPRLDDRPELGVSTPDVARRVLVAVGRRIGQPPLQFGVLGSQPRQLLEHVHSSTYNRLPPNRPTPAPATAPAASSAPPPPAVDQANLCRLTTRRSKALLDQLNGSGRGGWVGH